MRLNLQSYTIKFTDSVDICQHFFSLFLHRIFIICPFLKKGKESRQNELRKRDQITI